MKVNHRYKFRVSFSDADMAGIVYTARYTDFMLKAWEAYFADIGIPWESYFTRKGFGGLPVIKMGLAFRSPARCGNWLVVETTVSRMTSRRIYFRFNMINESTKRLVAEGRIAATAFNDRLKPIPIPAFISDAILASPLLS